METCGSSIVCKGFELVELATATVLSVDAASGHVDEGRVPLDVVCLAEGWVCFTIDLNYVEFILHLMGELLPDGSEFFAVAAPWGKKLDKHGTLGKSRGKGFVGEREKLAIGVWLWGDGENLVVDIAMESREITGT